MVINGCPRSVFIRCFVYSPMQAITHDGRLGCCLDTWSMKVINRPKDTLSNIAKAYQLSLLEIGPLKLIPYQIIAQQYHPFDTSDIKSMSVFDP